MTNQTSIFAKDGNGTVKSKLNKVIFKNYSDAPVLRKYRSLFPGLGFAAGYIMI